MNTYFRYRLHKRTPRKETEEKDVRCDVTGRGATLRPFSYLWRRSTSRQPWDSRLRHAVQTDRCSEAAYLHDKRYIKIREPGVVLLLSRSSVRALREGGEFSFVDGGSKNGARDWHAFARLYLVWREVEMELWKRCSGVRLFTYGSWKGSQNISCLN